MKAPAIRSYVLYSRAEGTGAQRKYVSHDALVIGYDRPHDHNPETDGMPMVTLAFVDPASQGQLGSVNWSDAFEQVFSVPHQDMQDGGHHFYTIAPQFDVAERKLQAFLLKNFKSETGDETPVDCAIRLLTKKK